jgi:hypothetical protein
VSTRCACKQPPRFKFTSDVGQSAIGFNSHHNWSLAHGYQDCAHRALNDELRQNFAEGMVVMTPGIAALGAEAVARIVKTIAVFDDFCHANDPYQEHDFGSFDADGHHVFFKIDYYDEALEHHSSDPADPSVTKRVITIMLADEY